MAELTDDIYQALENKQVTTALFVDFRKAFDCIHHTLLLRKFEKIGFADNTMSWLKSYLSNRSQRTLANGIFSKSLPIEYGVPQGSILGPLAFLIFINDLPKIIKSTKFKLYADDTVIYSADQDPMLSVGNIQEDLNNISQWCQENKMTINIKKTKLMHFGSRATLKRFNTQPVSLQGQNIENVHHYKYLGIYLDPTLNFNKHLSHTEHTANHKTYILRKLCPYLTSGAALQIYKSMTLPVIEYGNIIYGAGNKTQLGKLQTIQNINIKICLGLPSLTRTVEIHRLSKINHLEDRRNSHLLKLMYTRKDNVKYRDQRDMRTRRFDGISLKVPNFVSATSQKSIWYRGATSWNQLPAAIRNLPTKDAFINFQKKAMQMMLSQ